jgi:hypothetical protein
MDFQGQTQSPPSMPNTDVPAGNRRGFSRPVLILSFHGIPGGSSEFLTEVFFGKKTYMEDPLVHQAKH